MATRFAGNLETFFKEETSGDLRSIIKYDEDGREVTYIRDDVADQYSPEEFEDAIDDSRMEAFGSPMYDDLYSADHGDLICLVKCFEDVVEINFVLSEGVGAVVALDVDAIDGNYGLLSQARALIEEERE